MLVLSASLILYTRYYRVQLCLLECSKELRLVVEVVVHRGKLSKILLRSFKVHVFKVQRVGQEGQKEA